MDSYSQKWEDESEVNELEDMEDEVQESTCETIFREMVQNWLKENGLKILLEETSGAKPRPKYRRQNANSCFGQK